MRIIVTIALVVASLSTWSSVIMDREGKWELTELTKSGHTPLTNYEKAREMVIQQLDLKQDKNGYFVKDVYCQIKFRKKISPRTMPHHQIINIEHTWPQSRFNKKQKKSYQKSDLHHLYPTEARSNSSRGNDYFGEFNHSESINDDCLSAKRGTFNSTGESGFQPPKEHRGNVARALFYFSARYNIKLKNHEEKFLRKWHVKDPVDEEEVERNNRIESLQGNRNPFIDDPDLVDYISDF